jgi:nicotinamidase-related amidase
VRIFAYDRFKPGVTLETIEPYLSEEVANVWRLWKAGIVRENYARADEPGVVIVFELDSVEDAKRYTDDFPLTKAGFLEWFLMGISQLRMWMGWQRKDRVEDVVSPFLRDSPGFQIVPELRPRASEAIFDKLSLSAFAGTPLEFALRDAQVSAFAIVGVAMEVGLEPTVRHGADLGLIPVLVTDACGAGNPAAAERSLDALATAGDAILTDITTITGLLETARAPQEVSR